MVRNWQEFRKICCFLKTSRAIQYSSFNMYGRFVALKDVFSSEYEFYVESVSHGQASSILSVTQPLYTDVISYVITTTIDNPTEITFSITTESGVGSQHKTTLVGLNSIPRLLSKVFSLNQLFVYQSLSPGKFHNKHFMDIFQLGRLFIIKEQIYPKVYIVFTSVNYVENLYFLT